MIAGHVVRGSPPDSGGLCTIILMFSLNGRVFGNLTGLQMNEGERTRWYLFGLGSEKDFHTAHWHG